MSDQEGVQSERRNPRDPESGRSIEARFRSSQRDETKESVAVQCSWLEDPQHSTEELWGSQGERGSRGCRDTARSMRQW